MTSFLLRSDPFPAIKMTWSRVIGYVPGLPSHSDRSFPICCYQHLWLAFCNTFEWREGAEEIGQAHMTISPVSGNHTGMTIIAQFLGAIQAWLLVAWLSHYRGKHTTLQLYIYVHLLVDSTLGSGLYWLPFIAYNVTLQAFHRPTFSCSHIGVPMCSRRTANEIDVHRTDCRKHILSCAPTVITRFVLGVALFPGPTQLSIVCSMEQCMVEGMRA